MKIKLFFGIIFLGLSISAWSVLFDDPVMGDTDSEDLSRDNTAVATEVRCGADLAPGGDVQKSGAQASCSWLNERDDKEYDRAYDVVDLSSNTLGQKIINAQKAAALWSAIEEKFFLSPGTLCFSNQLQEEARQVARYWRREGMLYHTCGASIVEESEQKKQIEAAAEACYQAARKAYKFELTFEDDARTSTSSSSAMSDVSEIASTMDSKKNKRNSGSRAVDSLTAFLNRRDAVTADEEDGMGEQRKKAKVLSIAAAASASDPHLYGTVLSSNISSASGARLLDLKEGSKYQKRELVKIASLQFEQEKTNFLKQGKSLDAAEIAALNNVIEDVYQKLPPLQGRSGLQRRCTLIRVAACAWHPNGEFTNAIKKQVAPMVDTFLQKMEILFSQNKRQRQSRERSTFLEQKKKELAKEALSTFESDVQRLSSGAPSDHSARTAALNMALEKAYKKVIALRSELGIHMRPTLIFVATYALDPEGKFTQAIKDHVANIVDTFLLEKK